MARLLVKPRLLSVLQKRIHKGSAIAFRPHRKLSNASRPAEPCNWQFRRFRLQANEWERGRGRYPFKVCCFRELRKNQQEDFIGDQLKEGLASCASVHDVEEKTNEQKIIFRRKKS